MALRNLVLEGDPTLRKKCRPVEQFNDRLGVLLDDMVETMIDSNGVGLAGPQVGVLRRVVVILDENFEPVEMVNPEIIDRKEEQTGCEGCLSLPGKYGIVTRPRIVTAKYQDRNGEWHEITGEDLTARAICHELDHLDGVLYADIASRMLTEQEIADLEDPEEDEE